MDGTAAINIEDLRSPSHQLNMLVQRVTLQTEHAEDAQITSAKELREEELEGNKKLKDSLRANLGINDPDII